MRALVALAILATSLGGCVVTPKPAPFTLAVAPAEEPVELRYALPGQRSIFLVNSPDQGQGDGAIRISATAPGATIDIAPTQLYPGKVVEVTVVPGQIDADEGVIAVTITGSRNGLTRTVERSLPVWAETDGRADDAGLIRDLFVPWLARAHPEFGIDGSTKWVGTIAGSRLLVVSHYLYLNEEWELAVEWHVMIAPHDWATMYLRHRFTEMRPSFAAKIDSVSGRSGIYQTQPPAEIRR